MWKKKNESLHTITDVICSNTGMSKETLLDDRTIYHLDGLDEAVTLIKDGVRDGKTFYIMGDFDVDGIMASAGLVMGLGRLHAKKMVRLPRRFTEGYGLQVDTVKDCEDGQILITVDNGISAIDAIKLAKEKHMTVLVIDHHLPVIDPETGEPVYPDADLIIDPNAIENSADFNGYCGAGLVYKLCEKLLEHDPILRKIRSFSAIATIADSVPLIYENRRIVKEGLLHLTEQKSCTIGLYALLAELDLTEQVDEVKIGFKLAPVLNAPGRMLDGGAMRALLLMLYEGEYGKAQAMARDLVEINQKRRDESDKWSALTEAYIRRSHMEQDYPLVVYMPGIPEGIIGIIAGRMAEMFESPCILLGSNGAEGLLKGSGRSDGYVDLKELLDHTEQYLDQYGGHAAAAGIKLSKEQLSDFRDAAKQYLNGKRPMKAQCKCYDLELSQDEVKNAAFEVEKYGPYGEENPIPTFLLKKMCLTPNGSDYYKYLSGDRGVKLFGEDFDAVSFHGGEEYKELGCPRHVTLYGEVSVNRYKGNARAQFVYSELIPKEREENHKSGLLDALSRSAAER